MPRAVSSRLLSLAAIAAAIAALWLLAGCGGGDSESATSVAGAGGSAGAENPSGSLRNYGEEASPSDRADAAAAVEAFLRARGDGDAVRECALLAESTKETLAGFGGGLVEKKESCPKLITAVTSRIRTKALAQPGRIKVTGMRVDGDRGFVLYRDQKGEESAFAVVREGSVWKIGGLNAYPLS